MVTIGVDPHKQTHTAAGGALFDPRSGLLFDRRGSSEETHPAYSDGLATLQK
jgi:hypothetical protein